MATTPRVLQRLYLMQVARLPPSNLPAVAYLAQTDTGANILDDSALPAHVPLPPAVPAPVMGPDVIDQLAVLGLHPHDIHLLVCTQFDLDHAGHHDAFTKAELVVQRHHHEVAWGGHGRFAAVRPYWEHPALRYWLIDGDTTLLLQSSPLCCQGISAYSKSSQSTNHRTASSLIGTEANTNHPRLSDSGERVAIALRDQNQRKAR